MKIYHNPLCRKSRNALKILKEHISKDKLIIIEYLKNPLNKKILKEII